MMGRAEPPSAPGVPPMTPSRRSLVLAAAFLGLAALLSWGHAVRAQPPMPARPQPGGFPPVAGGSRRGPDWDGPRGDNWQPVPADRVRDAFNRAGRNPNFQN